MTLLSPSSLQGLPQSLTPKNRGGGGVSRALKGKRVNGWTDRQTGPGSTYTLDTGCTT